MHHHLNEWMTAATVVLTVAFLFHKPKERRKMWTENNDGITLPENMDASEHSGATEPQVEPVEILCDHSAGFKDAGELPGGRKIEHCRSCGFWRNKIVAELHHIGESIGEAKFGGGNN